VDLNDQSLFENGKLAACMYIPKEQYLQSILEQIKRGFFLKNHKNKNIRFTRGQNGNSS